MMMESNYSGTGADGGPISADNYKKAVYRSPPERFFVEMLPPVKQGSSHSYGMRISPIRLDGSSISSKGSHSEYEVWRRWEDCLWFQEVIEREYARMARSKRARLVKGRGVKKNGIYIHDRAASFESLPPGPDPNSVAQDIHDFVPKLTKRGTVFRASQATIDQRYQEFKALIDGLFREEVPSLIIELRQQRIITDFFGFWRRDRDLAFKNQRAASKQRRNSVTSSVFAGYFSATSPSVANSDVPPPTPACPVSLLRAPQLQPITRSAPSSPLSSRGSVSSRSSTTSEEELLRRPLGSGTVIVTTALASSPRDPDTPVAVHQDVPIAFGHKPQHLSEYQAPSPVLESLPEGRVLIGPVSVKQPQPHLRTYENSMGGRDNRNCQIYSPPPDPDPMDSHDPSGSLANRSARESWQSTTSVSTYLDSLDIPYQHSAERSNRDSVATFMTDCSADAVIPRSESIPMRLPTRSRRKSSGSSRRLKAALSDGEYDDDMIDAFFYDPYREPRSSSPQTILDRPMTALGRLSTVSISSKSSLDHLGGFFRPASVSSGSTSVSSDAPGAPGGTIAIKAAHNDSIVMLRVPYGTSFGEVRKRLYDKFVGQEGVPLSESFSVAHLLPPAAPAAGLSTPGRGYTRPNFIPSVAISDCTQMQFVTTEEEWEQIIVPNRSTKLTLRIIDPLT